MKLTIFRFITALSASLLAANTSATPLTDAEWASLDQARVEEVLRTKGFTSVNYLRGQPSSFTAEHNTMRFSCPGIRVTSNAGTPDGDGNENSADYSSGRCSLELSIGGEWKNNFVGELEDIAQQPYLLALFSGLPSNALFRNLSYANTRDRGNEVSISGSWRRRDSLEVTGSLPQNYTSSAEVEFNYRSDYYTEFKVKCVSSIYVSTPNEDGKKRAIVRMENCSADAFGTETFSDSSSGTYTIDTGPGGNFEGAPD